MVCKVIYAQVVAMHGEECVVHVGFAVFAVSTVRNEAPQGLSVAFSYDRPCQAIGSATKRASYRCILPKDLVEQMLSF